MVADQPVGGRLNWSGFEIQALSGCSAIQSTTASPGSMTAQGYVVVPQVDGIVSGQIGLWALDAAGDVIAVAAPWQIPQGPGTFKWRLSASTFGSTTAYKCVVQGIDPSLPADIPQVASPSATIPVTSTSPTFSACSKQDI